MANNKHLTLDDRNNIRQALDNKLPFKQIARDLDKDPSTISKEVRLHITIKETGSFGANFNACANRRNCSKSHLCNTCDTTGRLKKCSLCSKCNHACDDFIEELCPKLSKPPYVCNACETRQRCTLKKHLYLPDNAHNSYLSVLSEARSGANVTEEEAEYLDGIISPLIRQGQSPHHICVTNPDLLEISQSTVYRYIDAQVISAKNIDLPRKVRFRVRKKVNHVKVDKKCRINRKYSDFTEFISKHDCLIVELDSVEGIKGKSVLLTIHFVKCEFMLAFKREHNTSQSVIDIFNRLYEILGKDNFQKLFPVLLADNGTEFSNPNALEFINEERRTFVFYCDPSAPNQKGSAERNHEFIRYFIPKHKDISPYSQEDINRMMDHINSYSRESIGNRTPYEMFEFFYGRDILDLLECHRIPPQEVTLNKSIFSKEVPNA